MDKQEQAKLVRAAIETIWSDMGACYDLNISPYYVKPITSLGDTGINGNHFIGELQSNSNSTGLVVRVKVEVVEDEDAPTSPSPAETDPDTLYGLDRRVEFALDAGEEMAYPTAEERGY